MMQRGASCSESDDDFFDCSDKITTELCKGQKTDTVHMENDDGDSLKGLEELREQIIKVKDEGNKEFLQKNYTDAEKLYSDGLRLCPNSLTNEKSILFANRSACLKHLDKKDDAIVDCNEALKLNPSYNKAWLRRAQLHEDCDKLDEALDDFKRVLKLDPSNKIAQAAISRIPPMIEGRNEKLKEEMLGSLKDLGNKFLGKFGLSTDNFQLQQNPDNGSYNIQFKQ